jgi:hypothetical protein
MTRRPLRTIPLLLRNALGWFMPVLPTLGELVEAAARRRDVRRRRTAVVVHVQLALS